MVEIEFSTIPDAEIDTRTMRSLLDDFQKLKGIKVNVLPMSWGSAWTDLLTITSRGKGPHVSHVGGSWVSSLANMNALRRFRLAEIQEMGSPKAFMAPTWQSGLLEGDDKVWAIPWTGYMYAICYRKDMLRRAGITDFKAAFSGMDAMIDTIKKVSKARLEIPLIIENVPPPYTDLVHTAASFIWGADGDFVDAQGKQVCFNSPEAIRGLVAWVALHRAVPKAYSKLSPVEAVRPFAEGRAAMVVTDNRSADTYILGSGEPVVRENLGVANLSRSPWCGGGSFIIWKHTVESLEHEQAAVELVKYLTSRDAEVRWAKNVHSLMARLDALTLVYADYHPLHDSMVQAGETGRTYHTIPLWRRLEYQIAQALNTILSEARENPTRDAGQILHKTLDPLAERLNLTLA